MSSSILLEICKYLDTCSIVRLSMVSRYINHLLMRMMSENTFHSERFQIVYHDWYTVIKKYTYVNNSSCTALLSRVLSLTEAKMQRIRTVVFTTSHLFGATEESVLSNLDTYSDSYRGIRIIYLMDTLISFYSPIHTDNVKLLSLFLRDETRIIPICTYIADDIQGLILTNTPLFAYYICYCVDIDKKFIVILISVLEKLKVEYTKQLVDEFLSIKAYSHIIKLILNIIYNYSALRYKNIQVMSELIGTLVKLNVKAYYTGSYRYDTLLANNKGFAKDLDTIFSPKYLPYMSSWGNTINSLDNHDILDEKQLEVERIVANKRLMIRSFSTRGKKGDIWNDILEFYTIVDKDVSDVLVRLLRREQEFEICDTLFEIGVSNTMYTQLFLFAIMNARVGWLKRLLLDNRANTVNVNDVPSLTRWWYTSEIVSALLEVLSTHSSVRGFSQLVLRGVKEAVQANSFSGVNIFVPYIENGSGLMRDVRTLIKQTGNTELLKALPAPKKY